MLDSTYNLLIGEALVLFILSIFLYIWEYVNVRGGQAFEIWVYKFILIMVAAVMFLALAGYAPTKMICETVINSTTVVGNTTSYTNIVTCGGDIIEPDAGQVWLLFGMGFLGIFLALSWGIMAFASKR